MGKGEDQLYLALAFTDKDLGFRQCCWLAHVVHQAESKQH